MQQKDSEAASDLIRCLESTFRIAYGRDSMSTETRDALLYAQLQKHDVWTDESPSGLRIDEVPGALWGHQE